METRNLKKITDPPTGIYYRVLHDVELEGIWRAGLPEVFLFDPQAAVQMTAEIQRLQYGIFRYGAPSQTEDRAINRWRSTYQFDRAFANGTGFNEPGDTRADYITPRDLEYPLPRLDKYRVCGGASLKGTEAYSLAVALRSIPSLIKDLLYNRLFSSNKISFWATVRANNVLNVETIINTELPTLDELKTKPWLYFHATTSRSDGTIGRFPQGDGEYVLIPLITKEPVQYPLSRLQKMDSIADPYKVYL